MRTTRQAALALLNDHADTLTERAGQFLGHMAVSANPMTERQARWMQKLLDAAGLPPLADGGEQ